MKYQIIFKLYEIFVHLMYVGGTFNSIIRLIKFNVINGQVILWNKYIKRIHGSHAYGVLDLVKGIDKLI